MHVKIFIYYEEMSKSETVVDNKAFAKQPPLTHPQGPLDFPAITILKSKKTLGLGSPALKAKHFGPHIKHFQGEIWSTVPPQIGPLLLVPSKLTVPEILISIPTSLISYQKFI